MNTAVIATIAHHTVKLPPLGTPIPHLGGTFWALMRAKPGSGRDDYPIIVPEGVQYERECAWGGRGIDEPGAACTWDGLANTRALVASEHTHPAAEFAEALNREAVQESDVASGPPALYLPAQRELMALFAAGCTAFDPKGVYWTSTQYDRDNAWYQGFGNGGTSISNKSWEGWRARLVRRSSIESLID
jgi:hypothetical protein